MPTGRRLVIATGGDNDIPLTMFDMADIDNASADHPLQFVIQTRCDLGDWHTDSRTDIPPYGNAVSGPTFTPMADNGGRGYSRSPNGNGTSGGDIKS